jgi:hypothetical protein
MNNSRPIYIVGDIHGQFANLRLNILNYDIKDCYMFCVGDLGIGFQHPAKGELSQCRKLNTFLSGRNINFYSIRGNHDDPKYFNGPSHIELSNFKLLADYYTETFNGEKFLFVGGAVSVDRIHRKEGRSYWFGEKFAYKQELVDKCDVLITHSAPSWNGPNDKTGIESWCYYDKTLYDECLKERFDHDSLLRQCAPKKHYCGHFHISSTAENHGCISRILNIDEIKEHY